MYEMMNRSMWICHECDGRQWQRVQWAVISYECSVNEVVRCVINFGLIVFVIRWDGPQTALRTLIYLQFVGVSFLWMSPMPMMLLCSKLCCYWSLLFYLLHLRRTLTFLSIDFVGSQKCFEIFFLFFSFFFKNLIELFYLFTGKTTWCQTDWCHSLNNRDSFHLRPLKNKIQNRKETTKLLEKKYIFHRAFILTASILKCISVTRSHANAHASIWRIRKEKYLWDAMAEHKKMSRIKRK